MQNFNQLKTINIFNPFEMLTLLDKATKQNISTVRELPLITCQFRQSSLNGYLLKCNLQSNRSQIILGHAANSTSQDVEGISLIDVTDMVGLTIHNISNFSHLLFPVVLRQADEEPISRLNLERLAAESIRERKAKVNGDLAIRINWEGLNFSDQISFVIRHIVNGIADAVAEIAGDKMGQECLANVVGISLRHQKSQTFQVKKNENILEIAVDLENFHLDQAAKKIKEHIESVL